MVSIISACERMVKSSAASPFSLWLSRRICVSSSMAASLSSSVIAETSTVLTKRMEEVEREIYELAGGEFNIASPRQVGEVLFDKLKIVEKAKKTKKGQYVTNEEVLQSLKGKHKIVGAILEHRGLKKLLGTYIDALPKLINSRTGQNRRLHP